MLCRNFHYDTLKTRSIERDFFLFPTGILERPLLPPTVQVVGFKLFLSGKAGVGKTSIVSYLSGKKVNAKEKPVTDFLNI